MIKGKRKIEKLKQHRALINAKSKRRRNLVKKAMELSIKCELDVFLVIRDQIQKKVTTYESDCIDGSRFTKEMAFKFLLEQEDDPVKLEWQETNFTNESYYNQNMNDDDKDDKSDNELEP